MVFPTTDEEGSKATSNSEGGSDDDDLTEDASVSSDEDEREGGKKEPRVPLHRLMVDYQVRKEQLEKERREKARKSARNRKAPDKFVAEPASFKQSGDWSRKNDDDKKQDKINFYELVQEWQDEHSEVAPVITIKKEAIEELKLALNSMITLSRRQGRLVVPKKVGSGSLSAQTATVTAHPDYKGLKFPEQLMLLLLKDDAPEGIWWLEGTDGKVFAIDFAFFVDVNMKKYFPGNQYKRIVYSLKKWGFQISSMHKLQEGLSAHYHPLFRRDIPKRASEISLLQPRNYLAKAKKAKKKPDLMSNAQLNAFISNSMADAVSHSSRQEGADKSRSRFLYPYHGSGSPSALAVARAPETSSAIVTNVSQSVYGNISTSIKNAATGTERHGPSSYAITPGRGDFRNLNQTRDVHLRSPTAHTPNSFRRNNDRAANIVSPEQRNLAIKADLTKRMTSSVEEDQLIQQQLNQIRLNASLARSPLDILEAKAEFDRLTAQQMKLRERIMELDSLLRLCREAELQQQQAEELARRNQERLKGERAMKDENLRRQRLASALFGGTTTEAIDSPTVLNGSDSVNGASYSSTTAQVINDRDRVNISLLTSQSRSPAARSRYHESYESTAVSRVQGGNWVPASRETSPQDLSSILQRLANCRYR